MLWPFAGVSPARFGVQFEGEASSSIYNLLIGKAALNFFSIYSLHDCKVLWGLARKPTVERGEDININRDEI